MNTTRVGKIAHLPHATRELLNNRLLESQPGREIVDWLNSLPEVQQVLDRHFEGRPISEQNLSEWRQGGFSDWITHQEALLSTVILSTKAQEVADTIKGSPADHLATLIATKYALAIGQWDGEPDPVFLETLKILGQVCRQVEELRRGEHSAARLKLQQARVAIAGGRAEKHIFEKLRDWMSEAEGWRFINGPDGLTAEQRQERLNKLLAGEYFTTPRAGDEPPPVVETPPRKYKFERMTDPGFDPTKYRPFQSPQNQT